MSKDKNGKTIEVLSITLFNDKYIRVRHTCISMERKEATETGFSVTIRPEVL